MALSLTLVRASLNLSEHMDYNVIANVTGIGQVTDCSINLLFFHHTLIMIDYCLVDTQEHLFCGTMFLLFARHKDNAQLTPRFPIACRMSMTCVNRVGECFVHSID